MQQSARQVSQLSENALGNSFQSLGGNPRIGVVRRRRGSTSEGIYSRQSSSAGLHGYLKKFLVLCSNAPPTVITKHVKEQVHENFVDSTR